MGTKKNVFISHSHKDDELLPKLKDLLARRDVEVSDYSINSAKPNEATNPDYIKSAYLIPRIRACSTMVVLINHGTADRDWVNWEIEFAAKEGKRIVGVYARGATLADLPPALEREGDAEVVGWNSASVADAILNDVPIWENPDGTPRGPLWEMKRFRC